MYYKVGYQYRLRTFLEYRFQDLRLEKLMKKTNLTIKTILWSLLLNVYVSLSFLAGKITHMVTKLKKDGNFLCLFKQAN
jgi:hypothetical protein